MDNQPIIFGIGGLVVGAFVGVALGGSMVTDKINAAISNAMESSQEGADEASAATQEAIAALGDRIATIESNLSDSTAATSEVSEQVRAQLGEMQEALEARIDSAAESAGEGTAALRAALEDMTANMGAASQASAPEAEAEGTAAAEPEADAPPAAAEGMSAGVGETVAFADGAVRAFVSRLDPDDGTARISVNGAMATLAVGESVAARVEDTECSVLLSDVNDVAATLNSDCGGGGDATEEPAAEEAAAADVPDAPEDGIRPGQTVELADGALRVFVSALADDRSSARIAINGVQTQTVAAGDSVEVSADDRTCTVTVTGVGEGVVGLEGSCG